MTDRLEKLKKTYTDFYGQAELSYFSAPGRIEIIGNHTDHQHGKVVAAAVNADMVAAAAPNGKNTVSVNSEGHSPFEIDLSVKEPVQGEKGSAASLIRGVCAEIAGRGFDVGGFNICVSSDVPKGSGLSSSAAFEVLVGAAVNGLFCGGELTATDLAVIGQEAENRYFGKPSGLMDQTASAWGGVVSIDFENADCPDVRAIPFDFSDCGHGICVVDVGSDHENLTDEYASIPGELEKVCAVFGKKYLREVDEKEFLEALPQVRKAAGDRAILRAMHVFNENRRVDKLATCLENRDFEGFLKTVNESGLSSWTYLQNVAVPGSVCAQGAALALAVCSSLLGGRGACRIHGGGFGGTVLAFVPDDILPDFKEGTEKVFGQGSCHIMNIRQQGCMTIEKNR